MVYIRHIAIILSIVAVSIVQVSYIQSYDNIALLLNLPLLLATVLLFFRQHTYGYIAILIAGYLFDTNSIVPFGLFLMSGGMAIAVQLFLQRRVFKQRALHAIALLMMSAVITYQLILHLGYVLVERAASLGLELPSFIEILASMLQMIGAHLLLIAMGAAVYALLAKRFVIRGYSYGK